MPDKGSSREKPNVFIFLGVEWSLKGLFERFFQVSVHLIDKTRIGVVIFFGLIRYVKQLSLGCLSGFQISPSFKWQTVFSMKEKPLDQNLGWFNLMFLVQSLIWSIKWTIWMDRLVLIYRWWWVGLWTSRWGDLPDVPCVIYDLARQMDRLALMYMMMSCTESKLVGLHKPRFGTSFNIF